MATTSDDASRRSCETCDRNDKPMVCESGTLVDQFADVHRDLHEIMNAGIAPFERLRPSWQFAALAALVVIFFVSLAF